MIGNIVSLLGDRADYLLEAYQSNHFDVLAAVSRKYAHKIPFLVKIDHNELLTHPNQHKEILFGTVKDAYNMGAAAVGATIHFGSEDASREIIEISEAFALAHDLSMATVHLVLSSQQCLQKRQGLSPFCRPHRSGEPPRLHYPGRHHQTETS